MRMSIAREHMMNLDQLFELLEDSYTPVLDKNPDIRRNYVAVADHLKRFDDLDAEERFDVTMESIDLIRRIEFVLETFRTIREEPETLVH